MQAIHFGNSQRQLFGCHHPASTGQTRRTAVLICGSWGLEYMRSYRGLKILAQRLAGAGYDSLRFDYSGTGDSAGHGLDARLEHWLEDILAARRELLDLSGADEIAVVGLRVGALLAEAARLQLGFKARLHVSWDAPENGSSYVALMQRLARASDAAKQWRRSRDMQLAPFGSKELYGQAWSEPLAAGMQALPALRWDVPRLCLVSSDHPAPSGAASEQVLASGEASHWHDAPWINTPWVPTLAAIRLVETLDKELP